MSKVLSLSQRTAIRADRLPFKNRSRFMRITPRCRLAGSTAVLAAGLVLASQFRLAPRSRSLSSERFTPAYSVPRQRPRRPGGDARPPPAEKGRPARGLRPALRRRQRIRIRQGADSRPGQGRHRPEDGSALPADELPRRTLGGQPQESELARPRFPPAGNPPTGSYGGALFPGRPPHMGGNRSHPHRCLHSGPDRPVGRPTDPPR